MSAVGLRIPPKPPRTGLYGRLQREATYEVRSRIKLDALCQTLDSFQIPSTNWEAIGEGILRLEKIAKSRPSIQAGDDKMQMLFKLYADFKRRSMNE